MNFEETRLSTAALPKIWKIWCNVEHWPAWDVLLKRSFLHADRMAKGVWGVYRPKEGLASKFCVIEFEAGYQYTLRHELFNTERYVIRRVEDSGDGKTRLTERSELDGDFAKIYWALYGKKYKEALAQNMQNVTAIAERGLDYAF